MTSVNGSQRQEKISGFLSWKGKRGRCLDQLSRSILNQTPASRLAQLERSFSQGNKEREGAFVGT